MNGYQRETYGAAWASDYDQVYSSPPPEMIDRLAEFARGGKTLELAIGTGRVAVPLAERDVDLMGIDISPEMVAELRRKPGGSAIPVHLGDFADLEVEGSFQLIYLVFNTLFALLEQEDQIRCFANVAAHLERGGRFVTETFFPDVARFDRGQRVGVTAVGSEEVQIEASRHDPITQRVDSQIIRYLPTGPKLLPVAVRYSWPAEMDLMARLARLELEARWGDWNRQPFIAGSNIHISVYRRP